MHLSPVAAKRSSALYPLLIAAVLAVLLIKAGPLTWTGDEPRYVYQSLGIMEQHKFYPTEKRWGEFVAQNNGSIATFPYYGITTKPLQAPFLSVLYGPALLALGLEGARWANFVVGCAGLAVLYFLLKTQFPDTSRLSRIAVPFSTLAIAISLPFIAYLKLLYPENLIVCCSRRCTQRTAR